MYEDTDQKNRSQQALHVSKWRGLSPIYRLEMTTKKKKKELHTWLPFCSSIVKHTKSPKFQFRRAHFAEKQQNDTQFSGNMPASLLFTSILFIRNLIINKKKTKNYINHNKKHEAVDARDDEFVGRRAQRRGNCSTVYWLCECGFMRLKYYLFL